jgi:hypothetical protein
VKKDIYLLRLSLTAICTLLLVAAFIVYKAGEGDNAKNERVERFDDVSYKMQITSNLKPLENSIFTISKRSFKKTNPGASNEGFSHSTYEYIKVEKHIDDNFTDSLFYKIYSKDNGVKYISEIYLYGENLNYVNCGLLSFLETSNTLFLVCRDNDTQYNKKGNYWILGFGTLENSEYDISHRMLDLILKEKIEAVRGRFNIFAEIAISQIAPHKYYLTTSEAVYLVKPNTDGNLLIMQKIDIKYYDAPDLVSDLQEIKYPEIGWAMKIKYNQFGNLVIFSDSSGGGVIDTTDDESLLVDKSCFATLTSDMKKAGNFYNDSVDIFREGPYKKVSESIDRFNTYEQSVHRGGCIYREGYIRLIRQGDTVFCDIDVKNELIGCQ